MKKILIVDAEPWLIGVKKVVRLGDMLQKYLEKEQEITIERIDIKPKRRFGYFIGYLISVINVFKNILFKDFDVLFLPNCYLSFLTIASKIKNRKSVVIYTDIYPEFIQKVKKEGLKFYALIVCGRIFSKITDRIVIPSITEIKIGELIGIQRRKIHVIRNPVDTEFIRLDLSQREKIREKFGLKKKFVIGYIGRLVEYYRIDRIVNAISLLPKTKKEKIVFLLVGDGPERIKLKQLSNQLNVDIRDIGFVPHQDVYKFYSAMDLFVYPIDAIGIKLNEIMSVGIPVIAPKGFAEEMIIDEKNGFIVDKPEPKYFSSKIEFVMNIDESEFKKIRENMRRYAEENLSVKNVIKKYKEILIS